MERLTSYKSDCKREMICRYEDCDTCEEYCPHLNEDNCPCLQEILNKLAEYEDLEEQGKLLKLPCAVGDTVYVLAECESIPAQLDGTLYGANGEPGTATGYYCPYEDNCPFDDEDFEDCEKYKSKTAIFEDTVGDITIGEDGVWIRTVNCCVCSQVGLYIFLTKSAAEQALKEREGRK